MLILTVLYALADCPDYCFLSSLHKINIVIQIIVVIDPAVTFIFFAPCINILFNPVLAPIL